VDSAPFHRRAWLARLAGLGVRIATRHRWSGWDEAGGLAFNTSAGPVDGGQPAVTVLALGGASWPRLGSDGAWVTPLHAIGCNHAAASATPASDQLVTSVPRRFEGRQSSEWRSPATADLPARRW
jgi:predicted flavoprotein YhiN